MMLVASHPQRYDEALITEDDALTERDSNNEQNKEIDNVDKVIENLCTICLLSFKAETELKQHISKHLDANKISFILKNNKLS